MKIYCHRIILLLTMLTLTTSCRTLHMGGGVSYNSGNSGGCEDEYDLGIQLVTDYYFGKNSGVGAGVEVFTPGYTDCNDGDPLLFLIPKIKYRHLVADSKWAVDFGTGYAMGVFVDPGVHLSGGINYYTGKYLYIRLEQSYYRAFNAKENAIRPGTSSNLSSQFTIGIYFD